VVRTPHTVKSDVPVWFSTENPLQLVPSTSSPRQSPHAPIFLLISNIIERNAA
jgi:hypothetical protein